jgi:hypothetical protein
MSNLREIIETYINGNISTAKKEIENKPVKGLQIIECSEMFGIRTTIKTLKKLDVNDLCIINAFYDYDRGNIDEAKEILLNNFY